MKRESIFMNFYVLTLISFQRLYMLRDYTYNKLKQIMKDYKLVVASSDKDSCVVIMNKIDYVNKM